MQDPTPSAPTAPCPLLLQPTVVALGSSPELDGIARLGGRPLKATAGPLDALLGFLPAAKQAKEDAQASNFPLTVPLMSMRPLSIA